MGETIYVRGEGGAVLVMDLPLPEGIAERYTQGLIRRVHPDGTPYYSAPALDGDPGPEPDPESSGPDSRPVASSTKAQWLAYVVTQGRVSAEDAASYTKADLIELAGS